MPRNKGKEAVQAEKADVKEVPSEKPVPEDASGGKKEQADAEHVAGLLNFRLILLQFFVVTVIALVASKHATGESWGKILGIFYTQFVEPLFLSTRDWL